VARPSLPPVAWRPAVVTRWSDYTPLFEQSQVAMSSDFKIRYFTLLLLCTWLF
jgi:hypothetical protein